MALTKEPATNQGLQEVRVERASGGVERDWVAIEQPLEIRVDGRPLAVTMRTPGQDRELAAGFLFTEGVISGPQQLESIRPCIDTARSDHENRVLVQLQEHSESHRRSLERARRDFRAVAACGVCGKSSLEDIWQRLPQIEPLECSRDLLYGLPERMRCAQSLFETTGGIHAAALFDPEGNLLCVREDIGRHNAVDKLIGHFLLRDELPLAGKILVVSGRAGFEIVQKALMAAVPVLVAVGAASSLAVEMACEGGMALYSFVNSGRGNRHV